MEERRGHEHVKFCLGMGTDNNVDSDRFGGFDLGGNEG